MTTLSQAISHYSALFKTCSDTPHLDAEVLLMHLTGLARSALFSHSEQALTPEQTAQLTRLAQERQQGKPMAYITGHKEFWTLDLTVTPEVLIPRPETECLIEWIVDHYPNQHEKRAVADLGVGSGAIALALAKERPHWMIDATDHSQQALAVAKENGEKYAIANVNFWQGSWCQALPNTAYDIIVSNPPYIADSDKHLAQLQYEPKTALIAGEEGLDAIKIIIREAIHYLKKDGLLGFEHGYDQSEAIFKLLAENGYDDIQDHDDLAGLPRFYTAYLKNRNVQSSQPLKR